jgi:hypothetical protein
MNIAVQRLYSQRLAGQKFDSPADVVNWLGAVQAQDYLASLWAVGLRLSNATETAVEQAIEDRHIVRTWPMCGTIHFVPAQDAKWMVQLLMPRVVSRIQSVYRKAGLDDAVFARARVLVEKALQGGKRLRRDALYQMLVADGIAMPNTGGLHVIGRLASEAIICFGPREGKQPTFVLLDEWIPDSKTPARDEALAELARRYFTSHGPATLQDFVWWTGLTVADAKAGVEAVRSHFVEETIDGKTYWWREDTTPSTPIKSPAIHLIPAFDEILVSYKDRSAALDSQHGRLWTRGDPLANYVIVVDGKAVGLWKRTIKKGGVVIEAKPFIPFTAAETDAFATEARRYADFLGLDVVLA